MKDTNNLNEKYNNKGNLNIGNCFLNYSLMKVSLEEEYLFKLPQYLRDVICSVPKEFILSVVSIDIVYVPREDRRKGRGTKLINELLDSYPNNVVCLTASPTEYDFKEEPTKEEYEGFFEFADKFYRSLGFKSYNELSQYQLSIPYIFTGNDIGKNVYECMIRKSKEYLSLVKDGLYL